MTTLRLNTIDPDVTTLGPAPAFGIWVQGCGLGCRECVSLHTWDPLDGLAYEIDVVAGMCNASRHSNLLISGGEPMEQAPALVELIDTARRDRDWFVTCYSGHYLEPLRDGVARAKNAPHGEFLRGTAELVERLDLLIDGPYVAPLHAPLLWRGSSNQRLHNLSGRVVLPPDDVPAGLTLVFDDDGSFHLIGVPPERGMLPRLVTALEERGTPVSVSPPRRALPMPIHEES